MRRAAVLLMALLMSLSLVSVGASAGPATPRARTLPALAPAAADALTEALDEGRISTAEYALERARTLSHLAEVRDEFGRVLRPDPHAATYILRDLALRAGRLAGADVVEAERILARPDTSGEADGWSRTATKGPVTCGQHVCVHYVTDTDDKATPTWAAFTLATFEEVWMKEVDGMGFRAPKSDGTKGGDQRLDVYLDNIDDEGLYGYCSTGPFRAPPWDQPVYCVVDNDYAEFERIGMGKPSELLQVTAAHEFFHAVQFSYDAGDDAALGEMAATWMEDEVYDEINDNRYYRNNSMTRPHVPADSWDGDIGVPKGFQYGNWVWIRYLSERFGADFVNALYAKLDARAGAEDDYSIEGITNVLKDEKTTFGAAFADFAAKNAVPWAYYDEASEAPTYYRASPRDVEPDLSTGAKTGIFRDVDHLSSRYVSFKPPGDATELTVAVNMSDLITGSQAVLVSIPSNGGAPAYDPISLDGTGAGTRQVTNFGSMKEVVLVMVNASNRYDHCTKFIQTTRTCNGHPMDDNMAYSYSGSSGATTPPPPDTSGPRVENFKAVPATFSPNGDGRKDKSWISFDLFDDAKVTLGVFRRSTAIRYFRRNEALEGGFRYMSVWNGRRPSGRLVRSGTYAVKLVAVGSTGLTTKQKIFVTVRR